MDELASRIKARYYPSTRSEADVRELILLVAGTSDSQGTSCYANSMVGTGRSRFYMPTPPLEKGFEDAIIEKIR